MGEKGEFCEYQIIVLMKLGLTCHLGLDSLLLNGALLKILASGLKALEDITFCYCCNFGTIISSNAQLGLLASDDGGGNCGIPKGP